MPPSSAEPSLADPASQPSLQFVAGEVNLGRERKRFASEPLAPEPTVALAEVPAITKPSALPAPALAIPVLTPPASARPRRTRSERRARRRLQAARLRARWRKVSPYFAGQLSILGLAVVVAEWLELHGGQPLLSRFIAALGMSVATAPLWLLYLRRQRNLSP